MINVDFLHNVDWRGRHEAPAGVAGQVIPRRSFSDEEAHRPPLGCAKRLERKSTFSELLKKGRSTARKTYYILHKNPVTTKNRIIKDYHLGVTSMKRKFLSITCVVLIMLLCQIVPFYGANKKVQAFSSQVIQKGAVGDDVIELQSRLQYTGFYTGKIDGVFDWRTYWAVRNFQYEFGLPIDGIVGHATKVKLAKASKYNQQFVKQQIKKGNNFTHYGGVDLKKQQKPANPNSSSPAKPAP
ncbi:MAG: germination-specific spore cortex-lytic enzyme, partial [Bacillus sp. (in: firmicutes)]|nr:germination-specific spore cortex-lytic enzyme [Bacillus sp. (in: firmicutes)]